MSQINDSHIAIRSINATVTCLSCQSERQVCVTAGDDLATDLWEAREDLDGFLIESSEACECSTR